MAGPVQKLNKNKRASWLIIAAAVFFVSLNFSPALADEKTGTVFTLKESVALVLEKSLRLDSAVRSIEGAIWGEKKAYARLFPQVSTTYSYTRLDEAPTSPASQSSFIMNLPPALGGPTTATISIPERQVGSEDNWQLKLTVTQPIFTGFALSSAYELARLGVDIAKVSEVQVKLDLILQVKKGYFAILQAQKVAEVTAQAVKRWEAQLNVAQNFYEVGMSPKSNVLQAEVALAEAVQASIRTENAILLAKASFNSLLRRSLEAPLEVEDILEYKPFPLDYEKCLKQALETRPEIKAVRDQIKINEERVTLAKAEFYPNIILQANHTWRGDTWAVTGSPFINDHRSWDVTAILTLNVWDWGQTSNDVKASRTEVVRSRNNLTQIIDGIMLEVKSNYLSLKEAEKAITVASKAIEHAEENYRMSQERFREQVATSTEVLDAVTQLTSTRSTYYNALAKYNIAWATLERAMGLGRDEI
ncbi:MAG: TolC family protein [Candidatus Adiutricales bacterium]